MREKLNELSKEELIEYVIDLQEFKHKYYDMIRQIKELERRMIKEKYEKV